MPARYRSSIWSTNISVAPNRPVANGARPPMSSISAALRSRAGVGEGAAPGFVLLVAQQQRINDGIAEFADADLQRAGVAHQRAGVQPDRVIDRRERRVRRREQVVVVARMIEQQVERVGADVRGAEHEGHFAMHLAEHDHGRARRAQLREVGHQVHGDVGIAAQADLGGAAHAALRHHVRDHVHAARQQLARDVRVVGRQVVRLRVFRVEQRAGLEEELDDAHVGRHRVPAHRLEVVELGVVAEDARGEWLDEAPFEIARARGLAQAERREDGQVEPGVGARAPEELVGDQVGLADAERQRQHHPFPHAPQRLFNDLSDIIKHLRHAATLHVIL